jgi:hypothetical protein
MCYGSYCLSRKKAARISEEKKTEETSTAKEVKITGDTKYIVEIYNGDTEDVVREERTMPSEFAGMTREQLEKYLEQCMDTLEDGDLDVGLVDMKLLSFSKNEVVIRKTYKDETQDIGFFLKLEDGEVVIYDKSGQMIYENTGIKEESLSSEEIEKLKEGYLIESEKELYSILENFSS